VKLANYLHLLSRLRMRVSILLIPHPPPSFSYILSLSAKISLSNLRKQIPRPCEAGTFTVISDSFVSKMCFLHFISVGHQKQLLCKPYSSGFVAPAGF